MAQFTELGSPITITEGTSAKRDFSAGGTTNKKSVKFEEKSESKIKIYDEASRFADSENKEGDTSQIIQAKINTKINEINNKYF